MKKRTTILTTLVLTGLLFTGCAASAAQVERIDLEKAKAFAIEDAGFTADEVSFLSAELDKRNGIEYYDVDFTAGGKEYDYDIDALTGKVIGAETPERAEKIEGAAATADESIGENKTKETASNNTTSSSKEISEAEAKEIALAQVPGVSESDIMKGKVYLPSVG